MLVREKIKLELLNAYKVLIAQIKSTMPFRHSVRVWRHLNVRRYGKQRIIRISIDAYLQWIECNAELLRICYTFIGLVFFYVFRLNWNPTLTFIYHLVVYFITEREGVCDARETIIESGQRAIGPEISSSHLNFMKKGKWLELTCCMRIAVSTNNGIVDVELVSVSSIPNINREKHDIWIIYGNECGIFSETLCPLCDF